MPISNYPNGFANGVTVRNMPVLNTYGGNVYWVDSGAGADTGKGTFDRPWATLDYAVGRCTANNGDIIMLKAGHSESLTADSAVDIDVAGVTVIGMGNGEDRPVFTFTTSANADFKIAAANVAIANLVFKCNIASLAMMIETSGDDAEIAYCEFREGTQTPLTFVTIGVADNDSDRCYIHDCKFYCPTAGNGDAAISFAKDHVGVTIERCHIYGDFDLAGIDIPAGGNAQVDCVIKDCDIHNLLDGQHAIQVNGTGSSGKIIGCMIATDAVATALDAGGLEVFETYVHDETDQVMAGDALARINTGSNDIASVASDLVVLDAVGDTIASDVVIVMSDVKVILSDLTAKLSDISSDLTAIETDTDECLSDLETIMSDLIVTNGIVDTVASDVVIIMSDLKAHMSAWATFESIMSDFVVSWETFETIMSDFVVKYTSDNP